MSRNSYRNILGGTAIIGGATLFSMGLAVVRTKVLAEVGGPESIGLVGLFVSIVGFASTFTGVGLGQVGIREIVTAKGEEKARVCLSLRHYSYALSVVGALLLAACSPLIARRLDVEQVSAGTIATLAIALAATLMTTALSVELRAQHKVRQIALANIISAVIVTGLMVPYIIYGRWHLEAVFTLAPLVSTLAVMSIYARRISGIELPKNVTLKETLAYWRGYFTSGVPLMMGSIVVAASGLIIMLIVEGRSGLVGLGLVAAVLTISDKYLGFVLKSMGVDYLPRLAAAVSGADGGATVVNRQIRVLLALGTPILVGLYAFAPLVLHIMYSEAFVPGVDALRLFVIGDYFKLIVWPVGLLIIANGRNFWYFWKETVIALAYVGAAFFLFRDAIWTLGLAYLATRALNFAAVYAIARRISKYRPTPYMFIHATAFAAVAGTLTLAGRLPQLSYYAVATVVVALVGGYSLLELRHLLGRDKTEA